MEAARVYASQSRAPIWRAAGYSGEPSDAAGDSQAPVDLVVVGAASRDVTPHDPRGWRLGGSATYCSLMAGRMGLRVGCVLGVDAAASDAAELMLLEEAGVDVRRILLDRAPVFDNLESNGRRRQRWLSKCSPIPVEALPREWGAVRGWLLVPVAGEVRDEWAAAPSGPAAIAVGWQGMLRAFAADGWVRRVAPKPSPLLKAAGLVSASVDDIPARTALPSLRTLAPAATLVLTAGERGGLVIGPSGMVRYPAIPAPTVADPTGAGDVFLAALVVAWLLHGDRATSRALGLAAAAASCAVEGVGLTSVPTGNQVAQRLETAGGAVGGQRA